MECIRITSALQITSQLLHHNFRQTDREIYSWVLWYTQSWNYQNSGKSFVNCRYTSGSWTGSATLLHNIARWGFSPLLRKNEQSSWDSEGRRLDDRCFKDRRLIRTLRSLTGAQRRGGWGVHLPKFSNIVWKTVPKNVGNIKVVSM